MKKKIEPIKNLGYLFAIQHLLNIYHKLFKHYIDFELEPVNDLYSPEMKIIY